MTLRVSPALRHAPCPAPLWSAPGCVSLRVIDSGLYWKMMMLVGTGIGAPNTISAPLSNHGRPGNSEAISVLQRTVARDRAEQAAGLPSESGSATAASSAHVHPQSTKIR